MLYVLGYMEIYTLSVSSNRSKDLKLLERRRAKRGPGLYKEVGRGIFVKGKMERSAWY